MIEHEKEEEIIMGNREIKMLISKYGSNWFYCEHKDGNDILPLLNEIVQDLKELIDVN